MISHLTKAMFVSFTLYVVVRAPKVPGLRCRFTCQSCTFSIHIGQSCIVIKRDLANNRVFCRTDSQHRYLFLIDFLCCYFIVPLEVSRMKGDKMFPSLLAAHLHFFLIIYLITMNSRFFLFIVFVSTQYPALRVWFFVLFTRCVFLHGFG